MYKKTSNGWLKHFDFMLLDLLCLELSFTLACFIRHVSLDILLTGSYLGLYLILFLLQVSAVFFLETFKNVLKRGYYIEIVATVKQVATVIAMLTFYLFLTRMNTSFSRAAMIYTAVFYLVSSYVTRILWKKFLKARNSDYGKRSLIIISVSSMLEKVIQNIKNNNYEGFRISGVVMLDRDMEGQTIEGIPVVANSDDVAEYVCREWVDEVFINLPPEVPLCEELISKFIEMGVTTHVRMGKLGNIDPKMQFVERLGTYTVLTASVTNASPVQLFLKRAMDICGGLVGCILTGILCLFVGPAIYMASPGPVFFSQVRVGKNGKRFKLYKFRSMYMDAEERKAELMEQNRVSDGMMFKLDYDPRIIGSEKGPGKGIGNFIRKTSIDEFPQFWNVLKGDMSLVGTRPPLVDEWEKYELHHRARLAVKPGLTGMWQVSGRSDITDFEEVVKLDTQYIENWSIGLDIRLLFKTVGAVLGKKGSM